MRFRFITAYGTERDGASFDTFAAPFSTSLRLALGCKDLYVTVGGAAMSSLSCVHALPNSMTSTLAPLFIAKIVNESISLDHLSHIVGVIMTFWTFLAPAVTICNKCIKSNHVTEHKQFTRWKILPRNSGHYIHLR